MKDKIIEMKEEIAPEIAEHIERWDSPKSVSSWNYEVEAMLQFADLRPAYQRQHLRDYFDLSREYVLEVNVSDQNGGHVRVNKLYLHEGTAGLPYKIYPWKGKYYKEIPIEVEAIAAPGFFFVGWEGDHTSTSQKITLQPNRDTTIKAVFRSIISGIEEEEETFSIKYFPNPFDQETEIEVTLEHRKQIKISLHDVSGKVHVRILNQLLPPGEHHFKIKASHLSPGIYILNCELDGQQHNYKLVKY